MEGAIDLYQDNQRARDLRDTTISTTGYRLGGLLGPVLDLELGSLTARRAQRLYDQRCLETKPGTHRNELKEAGSWARWLVKRGYIRRNPFADVEPVGRMGRGKAQLTIDEARTLAAHCLVHADDPGAVAALLCLGLGLRASEACRLEPRHLDDRGRVLIVDGTKSDSSKRRLQIPAWLQPVLADALPLGLSRHGLRSRVQTLCRHAGVSVVCPHGLRGTHATLAAAAGAASEYVAASLGHSGPAVTERHYAAPGAVQSGASARVHLRLVEGGKASG